jgi:RND family efflux transporter, MFP subunit
MGALEAQRAQAIAQYRAAQAGAYNSQAQYGYQQQSYNPMFSVMNPFAWAGTGMSAMMGQGNHNPWTSYLSGVDNRRAGVMTAYADLQAASARIGEIDAQLRDKFSISPFDGVVLSKQVNPGDTVQPGQKLMTIASTGVRQVELMVPDQLAQNVQSGQKVPVTVPGSGKAVEASVAEISPQADPQTHTLRIKLDLPQGSGMRLGSYVQVTLPSTEAKNETPVIPRSALLGGRSLPSVLVMRHGRGELRVLRLGEPLPGDKVQVLSGLSAGETIVNDPPPDAGYGFKMSGEGSSVAGGA